VTVVTRGAAGCTAFADGEIDGRSAIPTWNEVERSVRGRVVA
jgi:hypothetical protein